MNDPNTSNLLARAARDPGVVDELMALHRPRVRRMLAVRMNQELQARVDPSDVVQEALIEAARLLPDYLTHQRIAFYPWLRDIAVSRMISLYRRHVLATKRSTRREEPLGYDYLPDESCVHLVERLVHSGYQPQWSTWNIRRDLEQVKDAATSSCLKWNERLSSSEVSRRTLRGRDCGCVRYQQTDRLATARQRNRTARHPPPQKRKLKR